MRIGGVDAGPINAGSEAHAARRRDFRTCREAFVKRVGALPEAEDLRAREFTPGDLTGHVLLRQIRRTTGAN